MAPVSSRKKQKKRNAGSDDESGSDLDLDKPLFTLNHYIKDRPSMLSQAFDVVGAQKIRSMLPPALKNLSPEDLKSACLDQLLGMSDRRIQQVLNGTNTADVSSSETSEDEEPPKAEPETTRESNGCNGDGNPSKNDTAAVGEAKEDDDESSDGDTLQIGITSKEMDEVLEKPEVVPETQGKTLLEILELEMRARAIRALLKQNNAPAASKNEAELKLGVDAESEASGGPKIETQEEGTEGTQKEKTSGTQKEKTKRILKEKTEGTGKEKAVETHEEKIGKIQLEETEGIQEEKTEGVQKEKIEGVQKAKIGGAQKAKIEGVQRAKTGGVEKERTDKKKKRKSDDTKKESDETKSGEAETKEAKAETRDGTKKEERKETKGEGTDEAKKQITDKKKEAKSSSSAKRRHRDVQSDDDVVFISETVAPEKSGKSDKPARSVKVKEKAAESNLTPVYNPTTDILEFRQVPSKQGGKAPVVVVKPIKPGQGSKKFKLMKLQETKPESPEKSKITASSTETITISPDKDTVCAASDVKSRKSQN